MKKTLILFKRTLIAVLFINTATAWSQAIQPNPIPTFSTTNGFVNAIAWDSLNNRVYIGGTFSQVGGQARLKFAVLDATTGALLSTTLNCNNDVDALYLYKGMLYIGGAFTTIGGQARKGIAKYKTSSNSLTSWAPNIGSGTATINAIKAKNNFIYAGGSFFTPSYLVRVDTGTAAIDSWMAGLNSTVMDLDIDGNNLYVGGTFSSAGGQSRASLAAYNNLAGTPSIDLTWDPSTDGYIRGIKAYNGLVYIGGNFSICGGQARSYFACVNPAGTIGDATPLDLQFSYFCSHIAIKNNLLYVGGYYGSVIYNTVTYTRGAGLLEFDLNTNQVTDWNPSSSIGNAVLALETGQSKLYAGGNSFNEAFCTNFISPIESDISLIINSTAVCAGQTTPVNFAVNNISGATSYTWSNSLSGISVTTPTNDAVTMSFSATAAGTNTITVYGTNGCINTNTLTATVNVYQFSTAVIANSSNITCGDSVDINSNDNYQGGGTIAYSWTPSTGLNATNVYKVTSGSHSTTTYTLTETSTEGCVAMDATTITVNPFDLNTSLLTSSILCSTTDSLHVTNNYGGVGTVTYTWSPGASVSAPNGANISVNPVITTDYTVTSSAVGGCMATPQVITVNVNPISLSASNGAGNITCGESTQLGASNNYPGAGTLTYTWSPSTGLSNTHIAGPNANPIATTNYTLTLNSPEGCVSTDNTTLSVNALQVNTGGTYSVDCHQPVSLTTSANTSNSNLTYSWTPATGLNSTTSASPNVIAGSNIAYNVTMSLPSSGCADASNSANIVLNAPTTPQICMVTSDSLSQNNLIIWDKTLYPTADTFYVYRDTANNNFCIVGRVSSHALSEYADTARHIAAVNGDPNVTTYRYKLGYKDSCGNVSQMSPYHNTIYQYNSGSLFLWNAYQIEGQSVPVPGLSSYVLKRDNAGATGNYVTAATAGAASTSINDSQYSTYQATADWRVETVWSISCSPSYRMGNNSTQSAIVKSKSNISNNRTTGIKKSESIFSVCPNPTNGNLAINFANTTTGKVSVKVISAIGQEVYNETFAQAGEKLNIDLNKYENGIYLVQVTTNNTTTVKRIVKN